MFFLLWFGALSMLSQHFPLVRTRLFENALQVCKSGKSGLVWREKNFLKTLMYDCHVIEYQCRPAVAEVGALTGPRLHKLAFGTWAVTVGEGGGACVGG